MYKEQNILYLLDRLDSVQAYEEAGQLNQRESQYEKGMKALASLDRVQQLNAIEGKSIESRINPTNSITFVTQIYTDSVDIYFLCTKNNFVA